MAEQAFIVTDLSYGDAAKGATVEFLATKSQKPLVVRHNGGGQAGHNIVRADGRSHTFSHFGSASFQPSARTHLSSYMVVNPLHMMNEAVALEKLGLTDIWQRTSVDPELKIVTPWHKSANRLRELSRGIERHGSCGYGVGEVMADDQLHPEHTLRVRDLFVPTTLSAKLRAIRAFKHDQLDDVDVPVTPFSTVEWSVFESDEVIEQLRSLYAEWLSSVSIWDEDRLASEMVGSDRVIFEGSQGVLLDEWYGFHPHTTWSTTTHQNALEILRRCSFSGDVTRLGLIRSYTTRHGAGPFVTENTVLGVLMDKNNPTNAWQGDFRHGELDLLVHRYAQEVCGGIDVLVVSHLDQLPSSGVIRYCNQYELDATFSVDGLFERDEYSRVHRIIPGSVDQLDRQEKITQLLYACSPHYDELSLDSGKSRSEAFIQLIESVMGTKVAIAASGPTSNDRQLR